VGKKRRRWKDRNREYKDVKPVTKALVLSKPMAIFYAGYRKS